MFNLHLVQAKNGDCFILEFGTSDNPKYILIDGGPSGVYKNSLSKVLAEIKKETDKLDLIILSHVDQDHIFGLLDLLEDSYFDKKNKTNEIINFEEIWFNTFRNAYEIDKKTVNKINKCIDNINRVLKNRIERKKKLKATRSYRQGAFLQELASEKRLNLNVNKHFSNKAVTYDNQILPTIFGNLKLTVIGPNNKSLKDLSKKWFDWVDKKCLEVTRGEDEATDIDTSIPNLSSIMVLAEVETKIGTEVVKKKILLTGDGTRDHIIEGLKEKNLLKENETFFVDILKIPHHGSDRNVDPAFFETIIADNYVISGDDFCNNPELTTLTWIVKAAKNQNRKIKLYCTNRTDKTDALLKVCKPSDYNDYELIIMDELEPSMVINLID